MTLTGTFSRTVDQKQRLAIPKRMREDFGEQPLTSLYIAPGTDKSLSLYTSGAFEVLAARLAQSSSNPQTTRNYLRMFYSRAERVDLDSQGRIRIPERLVEFAGIQQEVVLLGVQDHVEIWDSVTWSEFLEKNTSDFDELANQAFGSSSAG